MMAETSLQTKYPLLPYSQLVWDMMQTDADVYTFVAGVTIEKAAGRAEEIAQAVRVALRNHHAFCMKVDEHGKQYFEEPKDILHGQFHDVDIKETENSIELTLTFNRILGDGISAMVVMEDFIRAYQGLTLEADHYRDYLEQIEQNKQSQRYAASKQWLEATFDRLTAPVHPATDYPITKAQKWEEGLDRKSTRLNSSH